MATKKSVKGNRQPTKPLPNRKKASVKTQPSGKKQPLSAPSTVAKSALAKKKKQPAVSSAKTKKQLVTGLHKAKSAAKTKGSIDDLPKRPQTHKTAASAELVFRAAIEAVGLFHVHEEKKDYGTDFQMEALAGDDVTNFRVHARLKGTEVLLNADGSVSVSGVERHNLNYLLGPAQAIYVCYHAPTKRLLARYAIDVYREYEERGESWFSQDSLTVRFVTTFDEVFQRKLHGLTVSTGKMLRDGRLEWAIALPEETPALIRNTVTAVEVPADEEVAAKILAELVNAGHDKEISASFARFEAVLGDDAAAMEYAYLAEINLGLNGFQCDEKRIRNAIPILQGSLKRGKIQPGCIHYCIGNAWMALRENERAKKSFLTAVFLLKGPGLIKESAKCLKNLGTVFELQKDHESAAKYFREALEADPDLSEAHFALALHLQKKGDFATALTHLDQVKTRRGSAVLMAPVQGHRIKLLFQTGDFNGAFREITNLLEHADKHEWIWPSCARHAGAYGRLSIESTKRAARFWKDYGAAHPKELAAERERLYCLSKVRMAGEDPGITFEDFKKAALGVIESGDSDAAFLWDRLGHWAQDEEKWEEAADAYGNAHGLAPEEHYGYCYGMALNHLGRFRETIPILLPQAERIQPDAMSWFQVARAKEGLGDYSGAIEGYERAVALDPDYDHALFNLGGVHWNSGQQRRGIEIWREAIARFPNHAKVPELIRQLGQFL